MSVCFSPADKSYDKIQETETRKHPQKGVIILERGAACMPEEDLGLLSDNTPVFNPTMHFCLVEPGHSHFKWHVQQTWSCASSELWDRQLCHCC